MIRFTQLIHKQKQNGFVLIEAIFSVAISLLIVFTLRMLLLSINNFENKDHQTDEIAFAYVQLNRFIEEKKANTFSIPEKSSNQRAVFCQQIKGKRRYYVLMKYQNMIRMTTTDGGHVPWVLHVKAADFTTSDDKIKVEVIEKDGRKSELFFKMGQRPKDDQKKKTKVNKRKYTTK